MKKMKIPALLLTLCMAAEGVGCAANDGQQFQESQGTELMEETQALDKGQESMSASEASDVQWEEEAAEVDWYIWSLKSFTQERLDRVNEAVNEITLPKINVDVTIHMLEVGDYMTKVPMMVTAGDRIDLMTTFPAGSGTFTTMANSGQLLSLDTLIEEYCPEMMALFPEDYLEITKIGQEIYGVPIFTDQTINGYWVCRKAILDEAGIDGASIQNLDDITEVFAAVKEIHPELKLFSTGGGNLISQSGMLINGACYDPLGTELAAVMYDESSDVYTVESLFENDAFKDAMNVLREWYSSGYIDKDVAISDNDAVNDPTVFSWLLSGNEQSVINNRVQAGEDTVAVKLSSGMATTTSSAGMCMAIPVTAREPEAAARLLNLLYTDKQLKNLVNFGIEGEDYTLGDNGGVVINEEGGYMPNCQVIFGNRYLDNFTEQEINNGIDKLLSDPSEVKRSPLYGFVANLEGVATEAAQLSSVYQEYAPMVQCGLADETIYNDMIEKLHNSGLDIYLQEIQGQLDEWLVSHSD